MTSPSPHKHILVVSYSQSGQLTRLVEQFVAPLHAESQITVEHVQLQAQPEFAFPWRFLPFFNTFPETVHLQPRPIATPRLQRERYDLVIIAYTVWFLSPAQPITAFMQSAIAKQVLRDTPVVTLIGCRNMWLMAQEKMKNLLSNVGARLVGNVVKIDQCSSAASFITTPLWMLTGKKQAVSWLPAAGISEADVADSARFGQKIAHALRDNTALDTDLLRHMGAVKINEKLIASEKIAHRSFYLWGKLIMAVGRKSPALRLATVCFYILFLITIILTVVPISALIKILLAPILHQRTQAQKDYYSFPSGE